MDKMIKTFIDDFGHASIDLKSMVHRLRQECYNNGKPDGKYKFRMSKGTFNELIVHGCSVVNLFRMDDHGDFSKAKIMGYDVKFESFIPFGVVEFRYTDNNLWIPTAWDNHWMNDYFTDRRRDELKRELNMKFGYKNPGIKKVIFNKPATIVFWTDGEKTVVKAQKGDKFDKEKGLAMAIAKRYFGSTESKGDYYDEFKRWL